MNKQKKNNGKYGISAGLKALFIVLIALAIIFPFYLMTQSGVSPWLGWLTFILMIGVPTCVGIYVHRVHKDNPAWRKDHAEMLKEKQESQEIMKNGYKPKDKPKPKTTKAIETKPKEVEAKPKKEVPQDNSKHCAFCENKIGFLSKKLEFKDGYMDSDCITKYQMNLPGAKAYAKDHTVQEFKDLLASGKTFADIHEKYMTDAEKANEKYQKELAEFKADNAAKYSHFYFDLKKGQILQTSGILRDAKIYNFKDVLSYHINERGHNERKHHGITRAVVGGALAGGAGAIVGATTGGKNYGVIDHLGLVINMADGSDFEVVLLNSEQKANTFIGRQYSKEMDDLVAIVQAGMQKFQKQTKQEPKPQQKQQVKQVIEKPDPADEIAKFKKLADQGIITKDEFEAKKKQLLDL